MSTAATPFSLDLTSASEHARLHRNRQLVRTWLYVVVLFLVAIFVVGGGTRLTGSGLSITEWKPIHGVIPPIGVAEWGEEFAKYREIPQYQEINRGMSLDEFKGIFWWEWAHRLLARSVGLVMAVPLIFFWATGRLEPRLKPRLLGILALGGVQGAVGWWMVASGLSELTSVSQYRLATHLTLACIIFVATIVTARSLAPHSAPAANRDVQRFAGWMVVAVLAQVYLGALVAGLHAGLSYNTWPLMDGSIVPQGLFVMEPGIVNLFENPKTVQFVHRLGAYTVLVLAIIHAFQTARLAPGSTHARRAILLVILLLGQAALGITALLLVVPFSWAILHHAGAILVLGFTAAHWRGTKGAMPLPTASAVRH
ncbi:COX15/CtaA family protein [Tianweitania sp. BSSL-BM11]|uniref:Heme A synthase n=1 Tax=Tianweitania aestuarii TaxID=2814886 RepID=A0ABS5RSU5_9HYPH|nr:COX15/CtaA family protein [Tianweitania aestuarii]MBS9720123.1 COX15/CtaA family protein [Tianweitania aestuarii]